MEDLDERKFNLFDRRPDLNMGLNWLCSLSSDVYNAMLKVFNAVKPELRRIKRCKSFKTVTDKFGIMFNVEENNLSLSVIGSKYDYNLGIYQTTSEEFNRAELSIERTGESDSKYNPLNYYFASFGIYNSLNQIETSYHGCLRREEDGFYIVLEQTKTNYRTHSGTVWTGELNKRKLEREEVETCINLSARYEPKYTKKYEHKIIDFTPKF